MGDALPEVPGYDVEAELGRGGMGVVYRARHRETGAVRALKMMLAGRGASFAELARFRIEAEALACLNHPNIVKIRDVGLLDGYPYFAMDFAGRGSLKGAIAERGWPPAEAVGLVRTLALAMQHAHERGMLHRDLKPANVLIADDGAPIITDFGLVKFASPLREVSDQFRTYHLVSILDADLSRFAQELGATLGPVSEEPATAAEEAEVTRTLWQRCAERTGVLEDRSRLESVQEFLVEARRQAREAPRLDLGDLTGDGAVLGSPHYMAPEQAMGAVEKIGPCTDIYALGGILYELLTGRPPFRSRHVVELLAQTVGAPPVPPRRLAPRVPASVEAICMRCLEKAPDRRYSDAASLAEELARALEAMPEAEDLGETTGEEWGAPDDASETTLRATLPETTRAAARGRTRRWWPFRRRS